MKNKGSSTHRLGHYAVVFAIMFSAIAVCFCGSRANNAFAANFTPDPLVYIIKDITHNKGEDCNFIHKIDQQGTVTLPCLPGTIWSTVTLHRSQAISMHEPYVVVPPRNASKSQQSIFFNQMYKIKRAKQEALQANLTSKSLMASLPTPCGSGGSNSVSWSDSWNYVSIHSTIYYYIENSPNCNNVVLEKAQMQVSGVSGSTSVQLLWTHDLYAGAYYSEPAQPNIVHGGYFSHSVDVPNTKGYTYENWIWNTSAGVWSYCDIYVN